MEADRIEATRQQQDRHQRCRHAECRDRFHRRRFGTIAAHQPRERDQDAPRDEQHGGDAGSAAHGPIPKQKRGGREGCDTRTGDQVCVRPQERDERDERARELCRACADHDSRECHQPRKPWRDARCRECAEPPVDGVERGLHRIEVPRQDRHLPSAPAAFDGDELRTVSLRLQPQFG
jgi:hypothetical protein